VPFSSARLPAARAAALMAAAAVAGVSCVTGAQAAQPNRPVVQRAAPVQRPAPVPHAAPRVFTPRPAPQVHINRPVQSAPRFTQPQNINRNLHAVNPNLPRGNPNVRLNNPRVQHINPSVQHVNPSIQHVNPNLAQPKVGLPLQGSNALKLGPGKPNFNRVGLKPGPGGFQQIKPTFPVVNIHNKFWPIHKDRTFIWFGGHRRFFVPVGLLGVALIGGSYWYPDGYVSIAGPVCAGFTPDGCQLHWRMVDFEDGGAEPQCVQYCPRVGPPPAQFAPLPPPPPLAQNGACQLTIFAQPDFTGLSAPTSDNQPDLSQTGWRNEIASIEVQAGTWDFFSDENFGGESMRLSAGPYRMLAPEWTKRIGSFMCVQPGAPGA
jgi:Beta/Gamma crystallin